VVVALTTLVLVVLELLTKDILVDLETRLETLVKVVAVVAPVVLAVLDNQTELVLQDWVVPDRVHQLQV
jgi:hypothetical protein